MSCTAVIQILWALLKACFCWALSKQVSSSTLHKIHPCCSQWFSFLYGGREYFNFCLHSENWLLLICMCGPNFSSDFAKWVDFVTYFKLPSGEAVVYYHVMQIKWWSQRLLSQLKPKQTILSKMHHPLTDSILTSKNIQQSF